MKARTRTVYLSWDGDSTHPAYEIFPTKVRAKKHRLGVLKNGYDFWGVTRRIASICCGGLKQVMGDKLPKKNIIKMTITIEEEKI